MKLGIIRLLGTKSMQNTLTRIKAETPIYLEAIKLKNKDLLYQKMTTLNNWYTRILGLDEVKLYQDRVVNLQERLLQAQDKRREIGRNLADIRKKSNLLQDEIHKVKRQQDLDKFLDLMKEETEVLRLENEVSRTFQECDSTERELFTAFTNAVRDSHEKQRAQLEYTKYFGIILSITGSFLAFCYSALKKHDLKDIIEESIAKGINMVVLDNKLVDRFVNEMNRGLKESARGTNQVVDEKAVAQMVKSELQLQLNRDLQNHVNKLRNGHVVMDSLDYWIDDKKILYCVGGLFVVWLLKNLF